ncbi:MAG: OmpA family protein [bacterium]|nr:OmpA family protein [bacterium]
MKKSILIPLLIVVFVLGIAVSDPIMQGINSIFKAGITTKASLQEKLADTENKLKDSENKTKVSEGKYNNLSKQVDLKEANLDKLIKDIDTQINTALVKDILLTTPTSKTGDKGEIFLNPSGTEKLLKPTATDDPTVNKFKDAFNKKTKEILNVSKGIMGEKIGHLNKELLRINNDVKDRNIQLIKKLREEEKYKKKIGQLNTELGQVNKDLQSTNDKMKEKNTQLNAKLKEVEKYKKELEEHRRYINDLEGVKSNLEKTVGVLETKIENGRLKVSFKGDILFESGEHGLRNEGKKILESIFTILKKSMDQNDIFIAGHTDNVPIRADAKDRYESNWILSTYRAIEVVKYLVEKGMDPDKLTAAGYGEYKPIAENTSAEGKSKNRRVELFLIPRIVKR